MVERVTYESESDMANGTTNAPRGQEVTQDDAPSVDEQLADAKQRISDLELALAMIRGVATTAIDPHGSRLVPTT